MVACSVLSIRLFSTKYYFYTIHHIGAVFHYAVVGMYVFWTFHIGYFFYKVMFPFHANAHQSYQKYIHLIMAMFGKVFHQSDNQNNYAAIILKVSWLQFLQLSLL